MQLIKSGPLKEWLGWSDMTLWRKMRDPVLPFPQPITLGGPVRFWRVREVEAWIKAKAEADAEKAKRPQPERVTITGHDKITPR